MQDKIIKCVDCGQEFVFTAGERQYYIKKNLKEPVRCPVCRGIFKAAREDKFRGKVRSG